MPFLSTNDQAGCRVLILLYGKGTFIHIIPQELSGIYKHFMDTLMQEQYIN